MNILILISCVFFGVAFYFISTSLLDVATVKASKTLVFAAKQQGQKRQKLLDFYINKFAETLSKIIKLDKLHYDKIKSVLFIAHINLSPEKYMAKAFVKSLLFSLISIPVTVISPLFSLVIIGLAVLLWFSEYFFAFDYVKKRKIIIEKEVPRFASTVAQSIESNKDILKILSSYRHVAGSEFAHELDITIADMKSSNYENALIRLETRVGSLLLSDVIRGLVGVLRGDNQEMYFKMICFDMRQIEQNNLKKEASLRPEKMKKYSMMMLLCIILIYAVVLSVEVMSSLGAFLI
ncbi:MAG: hypothetical protein R3Y35_09995 [Clostridia bacterium]